MTINRKHILTLSAGLVMLWGTGCATTTEAPTDTAGRPSGEGEVNLYTARHYDVDSDLYSQFTEATGIKVNVIEGKAEELLERIQSEGANSPADVFMTVDAGNLWQAQEAGVFQPVSSATLKAAIPENLREDEGYWFALTKRARIIVYNTDKVQPDELSTYEALAEPQWQGRVCMRSSSNIYNQSLVAAKLEEWGTERTETWLRGLVANFARDPEGNDTAQIQAVASGQCDVAIANSYYVGRLLASEDPKDREVTANIAVFFPNQDTGGTHINVSGAGVVANAPNKENAVTFLEFLTTPEAQKIFASANNEYPVTANVEENEFVKGFGDFQASGLNVEVYGERNADAVRLMDQVGWK
ncbi:Fe(3+) ABC transporter substrate-binding protein [Spirulina subsalsa FACHB-351]|uniref:Fe(3+) ABC transporter substrate-binding protein n=1 Tax=Spirulina subsalsa FACHB-351 TaxID=234711 RepID=A0ABT3L1R2_9CYAN|nr:Fe(3+) ABC transporter substrate-binding protein [Spirulina subsalsa]MCW6035064.1 Fe(3+) ABC transporter substrate-binding protein [Spirulina subsalsa FACHB-351]